MKRYQFFLAMCAVVCVAGCKTAPAVRDVGQSPAAGHAAPGEGALAGAGGEVSSAVERIDLTRVGDDQGLGQLLLTVNFDLNKDTIKPADAEALQRFVKDMASKKDVIGKARLTIHGHTDVRGSDALNNALSGRRAASVLTFLRSLNAPLEGLSIEVVGQGAHYLLRPGSTEADHAVNRRAEIRLSAATE